MAQHPGLNVTELRARLRPRHDERQLVQRIEHHLDAHDGFVAFSGGKDSTAVLELARRADPDVPVSFYDSGLEFPETLDYIADLADLWSLNLQIIPAEPTALAYLVATGQWDHHAPARRIRQADFHELLIGRPAAIAHHAHGPGELWGIRAQETAGRRAMLHRALNDELGHARTAGPADKQARARHGGILRRIDGTVAFSPVWDWTDTDIHAYLARTNTPANPLYAKLEHLGAPSYLQRVALLVDGNSAGSGRYTWLRAGWPDLFDKLAVALPRLNELT